jgi:nucleotide-binding universal stress UspA family protein
LPEKKSPESALLLIRLISKENAIFRKTEIMKLLEKILVPVNVTRDSAEQISNARKIALAYHSQIILLYVIPDEELKDEIRDIVGKAVAKSLKEIRDSLVEQNISVREPMILTGKPVDQIIQVAEAEGVNLILLGSHADEKRNLVKPGVLAEQLIRLSDSPVGVVKPGCATLFTNIICPVDFSDPSRRALYNAILLARQFGAGLRIITVYEPISYVSPWLDVDLEKENASRLKKVMNEMTRFLEGFNLNGINHEAEVMTGIAHEVILSSVKTHGHDLLIMGTNGRTGVSRFFMGSVTEKVIREMPCSFIITKTQNLVQLKIDQEIREIEDHFKNGNELLKNGFYEAAIDQFLICLKINDMHIPSIYKLSEVYRIQGNAVKSDYYENLAKTILARLWDKKIELEIRRHYRFKK